MAFTIEEVEAVRKKEVSIALAYAVDPNELLKTENHNILMGYLTGKITSLQGLQHSQVDYYFWGSLFKLLKDLENPSENDQLVLDIAHHPVVDYYLRQSFLAWLTGYIVHCRSKKALDAALGQFKLLGYKEEDIFQHIVFLHSNFNNASDEAILKSPYLLDFLLNFIEGRHKLFLPTFNYYSGGDRSWSYLYFTLLEEANPQFANEYALYSMYMERVNPVVFFDKYKDGHYMPAILQFLTNGQDSNIDIIRSKLRAAMHLAGVDELKYAGLVIELSKKYLHYYCENIHKQKGEAQFAIPEFEGTQFKYLPYSTCAFHFLLKHDREEGLKFLTEFFEKKVYVQPDTLAILYHHLNQEAFPYFKQALEGDTSVGGIEFCRSVTGLLQQYFTPEQYTPLVWGLSNSKTKAVREFIAGILAENDPAAEANAIAMLASKNAETRQTAALVLGRFATPAAMEAIKKMLDKEVNDNARDILLETVADTLPAETSHPFVAGMVAAAKSRGKLNKPVEAWLDEAGLPPLYFLHGRQADNDTVRFLLYRMARTKTMRSDTEARYVIQLLDKEKSGPFATALIKLFAEKGAKPEYKYLMALAALLGNDDVADKIRTTINRWVDENRYKMAEYGVGALAIQGSNKALRWVEWYSRKYKSKKANIGTAALGALENAAEELGITAQELGDRIVPDFGFEGLFKHFTVKDEEYRAFIDSNFKIAFFDEDNKKLKAIPAAADAELKEEFKAIAKEVRDITKSQSSRLEYYLVIQRKWSFGQWQQFFLQNPVMFIYATKLLWGVYDNTGGLLQTFLCNEDTSLLDADNEEVAINKVAMVGIVHPSQLSEDVLQRWKQQFFDLSIEPIFPQLERRLPDLKDIDLNKAIITKFEGKKTKTGSIRSTLERFGWHKGPAGDGGMLESFNLLYFEKKIEAVLEIEGVGAGYGWGGDEKLRRLYIVDKTKVNTKWFSPPQNDNDDKLVKLKDVPAIFLHEMLAAVEAVKAVE